jgi:hypothetical protein
MDGDFFETNWGEGKQFSVFRALPYEEAIKQSEFAEVLDYEKASALIEQAD